ncbi:MAG: S-adenosyl-L-methionine-dependent methyltransferase [Benjaminiella poitrasii]|nr:MAG: S-adenosyl-L-methionine-dependent methyltransferase [Benjaminiella poitrasii]
MHINHVCILKLQAVDFRCRKLYIIIRASINENYMLMSHTIEAYQTAITNNFLGCIWHSGNLTFNMAANSSIISRETFQLYKNYSGIDNYHDLETHLNKIKKKLEVVNEHEGKTNYRCIQRYKFACPRMYHRFFYKELIELGGKLEAPYLLDVGCCTGTDIRKLLLDGYPKQYLIGMDIEQCYIDSGYALFKDNPTTCPIRFFVDDIFTFDKTHFLCGTIAIVHAGSVFHLLDSNEKSKQFLQHITWLLRPGGILVGGHVCADQSIQYLRQSTNSLKYYMGIEQFEHMLSQEGFTNIRIETQPRLGEEENDLHDFTAFWISFYGEYRPSSTNI